MVLIPLFTESNSHPGTLSSSALYMPTHLQLQPLVGEHEKWTSQVFTAVTPESLTDAMNTPDRHESEPGEGMWPLGVPK